MNKLGHICHDCNCGTYKAEDFDGLHCADAFVLVAMWFAG